MKRNILLVEPAYRTKFPPLGLMKISSYHKLLGDNVTFVKGTPDEVAYQYWDRIYVSTLFTYEWGITVRTIKHYKKLVKGDTSRILVGGIMASLMSEELLEETGIEPRVGVLDKPGQLDENSYVLEDMVPDYNLFNECCTAPNYTLLDSYFGYLTRGCVNKCGFCGVPKIEPVFKDYTGLKQYVAKVDELYGVKRNLVFFDNNILASKRFREIIKDIEDIGFGKGEKLGTRARYVDFNQGIDARILAEGHMELFSRIAINPLRIAFDTLKFRDKYEDSIRLAAKYEVKNLSNYILYNYKDTPEELWQRLEISIDLNNKYGLDIYSFPMKYIPLNAKDRSFINDKWNWQFIRNVQRILNVTKGSVMGGNEFFHRAFGESKEEFLEILHMPERILMYRTREPQGPELEWKRKFRSLTGGEKKELLALLCKERLRQQLRTSYIQTKNVKLKNILEYYLPEEGNQMAEGA